MKVLLGILILLFVVLTMGFADVAYATRCGFFLDSPEYIRSENSYDQRSNDQFNHESSGYYMENNRRGERFEDYYEYDSRPQDEFNYNDMY